jgi:hypothetical protein
MIIMTSPKDFLKIFLVIVASFCLGRAIYKKSSDSCVTEIQELREDVRLLEENLKYCWNELPMGMIRHGSIDY